MMPRQALIVDDSQLAQFVLKKMLKEEDITAECSGSGEEALEYLKSNKPDIIFLDHTMPGMNGIELLKLLKQDKITQHIPVMMYTSQEDQHYAEKALSLGAIEVLPKQLKRPDLHRVLITLGDKDARPTLPNIEEENEILEQIVYDAEEALKHETWQQRFKHAFDEHKETSNKHIEQLNERIDRLMLHLDEHPHKRQMFWSNIFWMLLFCTTLGVFAFIYTQQQQTLNSLKQQSSNPQTNIVPSQQSSLADSNVPAPASATVNVNSINAGIDNELQELQDYFNTNNIPFGDALLGASALTILEEIEAILSAENFRGLIVVTPLDSTFCVSSNEVGQVTLAGESTPASQCEFTPSNTELTENISVEVQQFINAQNANNPQYQYIIAPIENNTADLPVINEATSALEWNRVATNNRRLQFEFQPEI